MRARISALLIALIAAAPAAGQTLVVSDRPDAVAVTLYRDPDRTDGPIRRGWPGGYALITETRTLSLPAGESAVRFVGVSEGMMPETAIVTGLPRGVGEKNRDARLLSPAALIDAYLKRRVTIRRTSPATGRVTEGEAVIQAGPGGGVVLTTDAGVEALGCSGLPEALRYPGVPGDLAPRPTLAVTTASVAPATVTVQLSYLAQGFDWSAQYVARIAEAGDTLDLFAWLTVKNGGSQGFADARTAAVAGRPNKEKAARLPSGTLPDLHLRCWPMDTTSTHPAWGIVPPAEALPSPPMMMAPVPAPEAEIVVVSGSRMRAPAAVMMAEQEDLGDLKLYRVPEPVTVAALGTKQVAMLHRERVRFTRLYRGDFEAGVDPEEPESRAATLVLRTENRTAEGLGLPLPAGRVALFAERGNAALRLGETDLADTAVGEQVEFLPGTGTDVRYTVQTAKRSRSRQAFAVTVTNAYDRPVRFELPIPYRGVETRAKLVERKGVKTWSVTVPANGQARLSFALLLRD